MSELRRDARRSPRCRHSQGRRGGRARQGWPSATASGGYGLDQPAPLGGFVCRYIKGEVWAPLVPTRPSRPSTTQATLTAKHSKWETKNAEKSL